MRLALEDFHGDAVFFEVALEGEHAFVVSDGGVLVEAGGEGFVGCEEQWAVGGAGDGGLALVAWLVLAFRTALNRILPPDGVDRRG